MAEQLEKQSESHAAFGIRHSLHERERAPRRGAGEAQSARGKLPQFSQCFRFWKTPQGMIALETPLHGVAGGVPQALPEMRHAAADQHHIQRLERANVIPHKTCAAAALHESELHLPMMMPAVSGSVNSRALAGREER